MTVVTNYSDLTEAMLAEILAVDPARNLHRAARQSTLMALCCRGYALDCGSRWFRLTEAGWAARRAHRPAQPPLEPIDPSRAVSLLANTIRTSSAASELRPRLDWILDCLRAGGYTVD